MRVWWVEGVQCVEEVQVEVWCEKWEGVQMGVWWEGVQMRVWSERV